MPSASQIIKIMTIELTANRNSDYHSATPIKGATERPRENKLFLSSERMQGE